MIGHDKDNRRNRRTWRRFSAACASTLFVLGRVVPGAAATAPPISVELNKLEPDGKSCRAYIVVTNGADTALPVLKLDLIFFRPDSVIERRLALDLGPVRPDKKSVKTFGLDNLPCDSIGSVLVNDVLDCRDMTGPVQDCLDRLTVSSRASVQLTK